MENVFFNVLRCFDHIAEHSRSCAINATMIAHKAFLHIPLRKQFKKMEFDELSNPPNLVAARKMGLSRPPF